MDDASPGNPMSYHQWKKHSLLLYDMLINQSLVHPSPCFRWGRVVSDEKDYTWQRIYFSERGANPNSVVIANVKLTKQKLSDPFKTDKFDEHSSSPNIMIVARLETPEKTEVNKLYTCDSARNLLIAKSDLNQLHIWNMGEMNSSAPVATLSGHGDGACESNFALDTSKETNPRVLSGDRDGIILMWDIGCVAADPGSSRDIPSHNVFEGHSATVEDVCFKPSSSHEFCSVGDDQLLLFWDERRGKSPVQAVPKFCDVDLHCVDWNAADENLLVTGGADGGTFVFDRRKFGAAHGGGVPLYSLKEHREAVFRVGWLPDSRQHLASGGDDSQVILWDITKVGQPVVKGEEEVGPPEVIFKHGGHRGSVQDLQCNPKDPWCIASVSEDASWAQGGGTIQIWRPTDFLHRSDEDCLMELEKLQNDLRVATE